MFRLSHEGEAARLTIDRPKALNAIPAAGWDMLAAHIAEVEASGARMLLIEGAGNAFCAGADLTDFAVLQADPEARVRFRTAMRAALDSLGALPIPTVAWVRGACFGAGVALALQCDLRIAGHGARFGLPPARFGISYPQEDVFRLVEQVGRGQAARLLFTGGTIDGAEAVRIGLVELNDPGGGSEAVVEAILANSSDSLTALKRAIRLAADGKRQDAQQDRTFDDLFGSDALVHRLEAARRKW